MKFSRTFYFRCSQDILKITYCKICEKLHGFKEYNFYDTHNLDVYFGLKPKCNILSCCISTTIVEYVNGYAELKMDFKVSHIFKVKEDKLVMQIMDALKHELGQYYNDMSKKFDDFSDPQTQLKLKEAERLYTKGFITRVEYDSIRASLREKKHK